MNYNKILKKQYILMTLKKKKKVEKSKIDLRKKLK